MIRGVDDSLKTLADAGLALDDAEAALAEGDAIAAEEQADAADAALAALRERWPAMAGAERTLVGPLATPLRGRLDALRARLPKRRALSEAPVEVDPEQDEEPGAA